MSKVDVALGAFKLLGGDVVSRSVPFGHGALVVNYHRIGNAEESIFDRGVFSTTEDQFDMQMAFLKRNFDVISPHDLPVARRMGRGRYVIVTFDDGYRDNYEKAFPILKRTGQLKLTDEAGKVVYQGDAAALAQQGIDIDLPLWRSAIFKIEGK